MCVSCGVSTDFRGIDIENHENETGSRCTFHPWYTYKMCYMLLVFTCNLCYDICIAISYFILSYLYNFNIFCLYMKCHYVPYFWKSHSCVTLRESLLLIVSGMISGWWSLSWFCHIFYRRCWPEGVLLSRPTIRTFGGGGGGGAGGNLR